MTFMKVIALCNHSVLGERAFGGNTLLLCRDVCTDERLFAQCGEEIVAQLRIIEACAINIAICDEEKHGEENYKSLFQHLFDLKLPVAMRGEERLLLGELREDPDSGLMIGNIYRFIEIDDMEWVNVAERRPASPEEMRHISIPDNIEANLRQFPFVFDPQNHRLAFLSRSGSLRLSPMQVRKMLLKLVDDIAVREFFGIIAVNIEQEPSAIEAILKEPYIRSLEIVVYKPNGDVLGGFDGLFSKNLANYRASCASVSLHSDDSKSLKLSKELEDFAMTAASNGEVTAKITKDDSVVDVSTQDYPIIEKKKYPSTMSFENAFLQTARLLISRVLRGE